MQQLQQPPDSETTAASAGLAYTGITSAGYDHDPMLFGVGAGAAAYGALDNSTDGITANSSSSNNNTNPLSSDLPSFAGLGEIEDLIDLDFIFNNLVGVGRFDSLPNAGSSEEQVELEMGGPAAFGAGVGNSSAINSSTSGATGIIGGNNSGVGVGVGRGEGLTTPAETGAGKVKKKTQELRRKVDAARKQFEGCPVGIDGDDLPATTAPPPPRPPPLPPSLSSLLSLPPPQQHQQQQQQQQPSSSRPPSALSHPPPARAFADVRKESKRRKVCQACILCRKAHMSCDEVRPCGRCVRRGVAHLCLDAPKKVEPPKPVVTYPVNIAPAPSLPISIAPALAPSSVPVSYSPAPAAAPPLPIAEASTLLPAALRPLASFTGAPPIPLLPQTLSALSLEQQVALFNLLTANASLLAGASASPKAENKSPRAGNNIAQPQQQALAPPAPLPQLSAVYPDTSSFVNLLNMGTASPIHPPAQLETNPPASQSLGHQQLLQLHQQPHQHQPHRQQHQQLQLQPQQIQQQQQSHQQQLNQPADYSQFTFNPYLSHLSLLSGLTASQPYQVELDAVAVQQSLEQPPPPHPSASPLARGTAGSPHSLVTTPLQTANVQQPRSRVGSNASLIREHLTQAQNQQQQQQSSTATDNREPTPTTPYAAAYSPVMTSSARSATPGTPQSAYTPVMSAASRVPSPAPAPVVVAVRYHQLAQQQQQQRESLQQHQQQQSQQQQQQQHRHRRRRQQRSASLQQQQASEYEQQQMQAVHTPHPQNPHAQVSNMDSSNSLPQPRRQRKRRQQRQQQAQQQHQQQQQQPPPPPPAPAQRHPKSSVSSELAELAALAELLATTAAHDDDGGDNDGMHPQDGSTTATGAALAAGADGGRADHACTAGSDGSRPCSGCPFTSLEQFYLVAAGDQPLGPTSAKKSNYARPAPASAATTASSRTRTTTTTTADRLDGILAAKRTAGLLRSHDYTGGYLRLGHHLATHSSAATRHRIARVVGALHSRFTQLAQQQQHNNKHKDSITDPSDSDDSDSDSDCDFNSKSAAANPRVSEQEEKYAYDEEEEEKEEEEDAFERLLLDYDTIFAMSGIPAAAWRRTGEIVRANREFAKLVRLDPRLLRDGLVCIYDLMDEESGARYWEQFAAVAFVDRCRRRGRRRRKRGHGDGGGGGLRLRQRRRRVPENQKEMHDEAETRQDNSGGGVNTPKKEEEKEQEQDQEEEEQEHPKGFMSSTPATLRVSRGTHKEREIACAYAVTVRRDTRGVPLLCAGNFIRVFDDSNCGSNNRHHSHHHHHHRREGVPVVLPDWVQEGVDAAVRRSQVEGQDSEQEEEEDDDDDDDDNERERRGSSASVDERAASESSSVSSSSSASASEPPSSSNRNPQPPLALQQQQQQPANTAINNSNSSSSGAADVASLIAMLGDGPIAERELLRRALEDLVGVRG
ncbi:hypothetical protein HDU87_007024 [Geranomyces variabilis]|uniref:Zn(2)-C6 fungal-type domain-containing protein n=1 Tax=Geranomyces variabilis TaxID=109894 RepID=A0AAD5XQ65_9FUNG|nr:hypothetical protein HDU87_007024 [Geranomyces variabilis]